MKLPELPYQPVLPVVLRHAAREFGARDFIVTPDSRLSYAQAEAASRRVARDLLGAGAGKGTRIGVQLENGVEWVLAWFAIVRIGAVMVTLSTAYKPAELAKVARHADLAMLITQDRLFGADHLVFLELALPGLRKARGGPLWLEEAPYLRAVRVCGGRQAPWSSAIDLSASSDESASPVSETLLEAIESEITPADLAFMIYTSGTTGDPKGVMHSHGNALRHGYQLAWLTGMEPEWRYYMGAPFFWVFGIGMILGAAIHKGAAVLTIGKHDHDRALALMEAEHATHVGLWPTIRQKLDHHIAENKLDVSGIPGFAAAKAGRVDFGAPPGHNSLGMTETCGPHSGPPPEELGRAVAPSLAASFGVPVPGVEYKLLDVESGAPVPPGAEGQLCVRGYSLMHSLYKKERHETFDDDGWLHTGDRAAIRDGLLFFTGRHSEMIKSAGANVAPGEVEAALYAAPGVGLAIVIGLPDKERGEIVGAVLVSKPEVVLEVAAIKAKVETLLSGYKLPRKYLLLSADELPYLASGKPDKKKLREWLVERGLAAR